MSPDGKTEVPEVGNVFWRDVPADAFVVDLGPSWIVRFSDGRKGGAYWMGNDAVEAQTWLRKRASLDVVRVAVALRGRGFEHWSRQPVIEQGHTDNLVHDDGSFRVWISRMVLADYDGDRARWDADRITVEHCKGGRWERVEVPS